MSKVIQFKCKGKGSELVIQPAQARGIATLELDQYGTELLEEFVILGFSNEEEVFVAQCDTMTLLNVIEQSLEALKGIDIPEWEKTKIEDRLKLIDCKLSDLQLEYKRW